MNKNMREIEIKLNLPFSKEWIKILVIYWFCNHH